MKYTKLSVLLACSFSALSMAVPAVHADELRIEPVVTVHHSDESADAMYQLGRYHQNANRLDEAAEAYRAALAKDANYLEARNALATIYIAQKDMPAAVAELQAILQAQPGLSHVHSNLGYTYLLDNQYPAALSELAQALMIDAANERAFGNLALAYERLGALVKERNARAPSTVVAAPATVPDPAKPVEQTPAAQATTSAQPEMAAQAETVDNVTAAAVPDADTFSQTVAESGVAIEIANGTRDDAGAEKIADALRTRGVKVDRMTGLSPYKQQRTVILYRDGYRKAALELSNMFAVRPAVVNNTRTRKADDQSAVRLVLGKTAANAEIRVDQPQLTASR